MRIFSIELENFRMFEHKRVEFPAMFTVLIGENGSGKTTVLEGVASFLQLGLLGEWGSNTILGNPRMPSEAMTRYFLDDFDNKVRANDLGIGADYELPEYTRESIKQAVVVSSTGREGGGWRKKSGDTDSSYWIPQTFHFVANAKRKLLAKEHPILPVLEYFDTSSRSRRMDGNIDFKENGTRLENGYLGALEGGNLSREYFLSWFKTFEIDARADNPQEYVKEHLDCVKSAITSVIPQWKNISFNLANNDLVGTLVTSDGQEKRTFLKELSDGYRSIIILAATIAWRCIRLNPHLGKNAAKDSPGIVLIDELDQHLHPNWQKRIVGDLKRTFPKIQFICTTHSPYILQSLRAEEVFDLDGMINYNPNTLDLELVSELMGVESAYSLDQQKMEEQSTEYLKTVETAIKEGIAVGPDVSDKLDLMEENVSDPSVRAFLKMQRLKLQEPG